MAQDDNTPTSAEKGKGKLDDLKDLERPGSKDGSKNEKDKSKATEDGLPKEGTRACGP